MNLPIRVRLTAWYAALLATTTIVLGTFLLLQLRADLRQEIDEEAATSSVAIVRAVADDGDTGIADRATDIAEAAEDFEEAAITALPSHEPVAAQILAADGAVLAGYGDVAGAEPMSGSAAIRAALSGQPAIETARLGPEGQSYRVRTTAFRDSGRDQLLVVAVSLERVERDVHTLLVLLLIAGPAALAGTALAAYWLACKALRPLGRMTSDAQEIRTGRLHERVALPAARDEMRHLAVTLNAMLDRIEEGVNRQHRLVADASHELRTPLAVMRTEIDVSLRGDELPPAAREVLVSAREEVDQMSRTVANLLTLAAVDESRLELLTVRVDVRGAAEDAASRLEALAAAKSVSVALDGERWETRADPQQLRLALSNLIDNAITYSRPGGVVRVRSWCRDGEVGITVADDGPGIPVLDRPHVFDRFYRVDSARGRTSGGSGLGLAICQEVAVAHGGRVWVDSELGKGSAFSLALPSWRAFPTQDEAAALAAGSLRSARLTAAG